MKILYHHRTVSRDGQDVHITELIAALRRRGHEVLVVAPPQHQAGGFGHDGGLVARLKRLLPKAAYELLELGYSVPAYRRLARAARDFKPDLLYERHNLLFLAGRWLKARTGLPMLLEVNAPLAHERGANGGLGLPWLARWSEASVWRAADRVLPVTNELARFVVEGGVSPERVAVIPNGIDPRRFHPAVDGIEVRRRLGLEGRVVLGFTGFMREWHGLTHVLDAMAVLGRTDTHLLIVGDGPVRDDLQARARSLGLVDRLTILGVVEREQVAAHIAAFDVALQPRVVPYASPLKLFEYMALGRAILAPDQPNIREILSHGRDALLFDPDDPAAFRGAIAAVLGDDDLRRRLGEGAAATVAARGLTWDANAERVESLALDLLGASTARTRQAAPA